MRDEAKADLYNIYDNFPMAPELILEAINDREIDGGSPFHCIKGKIANAYEINYYWTDERLGKVGADNSPIEVFIQNVRTGTKPDELKWVEAWTREYIGQ